MLFANSVGASDDTPDVYVHVAGLGIGAWALNEEKQTDLMLEVYNAVLEEYHQKGKLKNINTVDFSWFEMERNTVMTQNIKPIKLVFSKRNPGEVLADQKHKMVAMYAWDGNSWPGNEYWCQKLSNSGDPAAACCSAIPILQNPDINETLTKKECIKSFPDKNG